METIYVKTGKEVYKDMTKFWGKLFGINFALGGNDRVLSWSSNSGQTGLIILTM